MYIALRNIKVQTANGVEIRKPGEAVPEAEKWPNPRLWIERGYIEFSGKGGKGLPVHHRGKTLPNRKAEESDLKRGGLKKPEEKKADPILEEADKNEDGRISKTELLKLQRNQLDELAGNFNLEGPFKNKEAIADALLAIEGFGHLQPESETPVDPEPEADSAPESETPVDPELELDPFSEPEAPPADLPEE